MSENIDISNTLNKLTLQSNVDKKRQPRAKYNTDKKKYKQSSNQETITADKGVVNSVKTKPAGQAPPLQKHKGANHNSHNAQQRPSKNSACKEEWTPYKFNVTNQDIEVCRQTAIQLNDVRESIKVDPRLFHHLNILACLSAQNMFNQQRNAFTFQEQLKQIEVMKWLNSKTEEERKEYLDNHCRSNVNL